MAQPRGRGVPVGEALGWIAVADLGQRERAALGDLAGARDRGGVVGEEGLEGRGRQQRMPGVGLGEHPGGLHRGPVADAGEHVLEIAPLRAVVEDLDAGHHREAEPRRSGAQPGLLLGLSVAAVSRRQGMEAVPEGFDQGRGHRVGRGRAHQQAAVAAPERQQPLRPRADLVPAHGGLALLAAPAAGGEEAAEVGVALAVLGQQHQRRGERVGSASGDRHLGAHQ
jgi:hypothetical protein